MAEHGASDHGMVGRIHALMGNEVPHKAKPLSCHRARHSDHGNMTELCTKERQDHGLDLSQLNTESTNFDLLVSTTQKLDISGIRDATQIPAAIHSLAWKVKSTRDKP